MQATLQTPWHTPAGAQVPTEPIGLRVLDGECAVPQNCKAAVSLSNGTAVTGGQADNKQPAVPQEAGSCSSWVLKALTEEHLCECSSTIWVGRHVKRATEPTRTLHYCCSHVEGACSPAQHPRNGCPIMQCSKSARALQYFGWTYFTFPPRPYLSRAVGMDRSMPCALSPADLYLFTLE